jgi:hypothetical protein
MILAKTSGLSWTTLTVQDAAAAAQDIRNDVTNMQFGTPRAVQDVTGIDKAAMERLLLLADFTITMNGVFNAAANMSHAVFSTIPSTSVARAVAMTVAGKSLSANVLLTDYPLTRAAGGALTWAVPGSLADGVVPVWS